MVSSATSVSRPRPEEANLTRPFQQRQRLVLGLYGGLCLLSVALFTGVGDPAVRAFALGLLAPGAGFLFWASDANTFQAIAVLAACTSFSMFVLSLIIWFATGNALFPPVIWLGTAIMAAASSSYFRDGTETHVWPGSLGLVTGSNIIAFIGIWFAANRSIFLRSRQANISKPFATAKPSDCPITKELTKSDVQHLHLLFDRALQPVEEFNGFEWLDQFQTASVRYQLNFASYALSVAQATHMPAFQGYMKTAQENLATKQQDYRIWRYWRLENAWGNLRFDADPIPNANIMYTGFVAAQLAYYQAASGARTYDESGSFVCQKPNGAAYSYCLPQFTEILTRQYSASKFGLLGCEPNWVYPLCNAITATAIKACDVQHGTEHWQQIKASFRNHLEAEFIRDDGQLVPFRSSYTGFAVPAIGGAVMQGFPCLFLNTLFPDLAEDLWGRFKQRLDRQNWDHAFWPIDIGNYKFSRAAGYSATAAAAVEMGDHELAERLFVRLDETCPTLSEGNVVHRQNASLWANALYLMARCGETGMVGKVTNGNIQPQKPLPFIKHVAYPDVLVASALNEGTSLLSVLYPGKECGFKEIVFGGLVPFGNYHARLGEDHSFKADQNGEARLNIPLNGRTELRIDFNMETS